MILRFVLVFFLAVCATAQTAKPAKPPKPAKTSAAEQYASALVDLLKNYQKQLGDKTDAEHEAYEAAAHLYDSAFRDGLFDALQIDRTVATQDDQRALEAGTLKPEQFLLNLRQYAQHDFDQTRTAYGLGIDSYSSYIANLDSIDANAAKITALIDILNDLAKRQSLSTRLKDLTSYGDSFVKQYKFSDCSMSDSLATIAATRQAALQAQLDSVNSSLKDPATKDPAALQKQKTTLQDDVAAAQAEVTRLQNKRAASGAYTAINDTSGKCEVK